MVGNVKLSLSLLVAFLLLSQMGHAMTVAVSIPEKYAEIQAGEQVYFETEVKWPENDGRKDLRLEYVIRSQDGEDIAYLKVLKAIETQASFMDSMSVAESTKPGVYNIYLELKDYGNLSQEVAASFRVAKKKSDMFNTYLLIALGFIGVVALLIVTELFILIKKKKE